MALCDWIKGVLIILIPSSPSLCEQFISWATYSDGAALAADDGASKRYMTVLKRFAGLATKDSVVSGSSSLEKVDDAETRNR